jgi:hypothetical protein
LVEWILESTEDEIRVGVFRTPDLSMQAYRSTFVEYQPPWMPPAPKPESYMRSPVESWQFISWQEFHPGIKRGALGFPQVVFGIDDLDAYIFQELRRTGPVVLGTWET